MGREGWKPGHLSSLTPRARVRGAGSPDAWVPFPAWGVRPGTTGSPDALVLSYLCVRCKGWGLRYLGTLQDVGGKLVMVEGGWLQQGGRGSLNTWVPQFWGEAWGLGTWMPDFPLA